MLSIKLWGKKLFAFHYLKEKIKNGSPQMFTVSTPASNKSQAIPTTSDKSNFGFDK